MARAPIEILAPDEVADFWACDVPIEATWVPDDELARAIAEQRVEEASSWSSMGTAETWWVPVTSMEYLAKVRDECAVWPPGHRCEQAGDSYDDRDVIGVLWEPFWKEQRNRIVRAVPAESHPSVLAEYARALGALEELWASADDLAKRARLIAVLYARAPSIDEVALDGWLATQRHAGMGNVLVRGARARWLTQNVASLFDAVIAAADRFAGKRAAPVSPRVIRHELLRLVVRVARGRPWRAIPLASSEATFVFDPSVLADRPPPAPPRTRRPAIERCRLCRWAVDAARLEPMSHGELLRCPRCHTFYVVAGDAVVRITPNAAVDHLSRANYPGLRELATERAKLVDELAGAVAHPGKWSHLVGRYARDSVLHAWLMGRDFERLESELVRHPDPIVRAEVTLELVERGVRDAAERTDFEASLDRAAWAFLLEHSPVTMLAGLVAEFPRPAGDSDTRQLATRALTLLAEASPEAARQLARVTAELRAEAVRHHRQASRDAVGKDVPVGTDVERAAKILKAGGLVAFPTETVYGLGADASRDDAAAKIFAVKRRPLGHPLIVHLAPGASLDGWAREIPDSARRLAAAAWPGPLTIILKRGPRVALATTGGADTVGLRVPAHPMAWALLTAFGGGIAAPSANRFGAVSPTRAEHVIADLGDEVDYVLDGGACNVGVESTIVDLSRERPVLMRPGGMRRETIEAFVGPLEAPDAQAPAAPGTLASHYAPAAEVIAVEPADVPATVARVRETIAQRPTEMAAPVEERKGMIAVLAPAGAFAAWGKLGDDVVSHRLPDDVPGIARGLYAALRDLDESGVDVVIAALPPAAGLGEAVGDRLRRAAGPRDKASSKR